MPRLLTVDEAADELGVPPGSLRTAARRHGLLIKLGRAVRIDPDDLQELVRQCRDTPRARDSIATSTVSGISATTGENSSQRALEVAAKLKALSRGTSPRSTDRQGQLHRIK